MRMLSRIQARMAQRGVELILEPQVPVLLAGLGVDAMSGARNLRRLIAARVEEPLADMLLAGTIGERVRLDVRDGELHFSCGSEAPSAQEALVTG